MTIKSIQYNCAATDLDGNLNFSEQSLISM